MLMWLQRLNNKTNISYIQLSLHEAYLEDRILRVGDLTMKNNQDGHVSSAKMGLVMNIKIKRLIKIYKT
jgi:hypothetical protein